MRTLGIDVGQKHLGVCVWDGARVQQWAIWESAGSWAPEVCACLRANATPAFLDGVTQVVIERQPSKNPSMTRIMHYLEFFFVGLGLPVALQDAKHKLLFATTTPWFPADSTDREWTYRHRKKLAVETTAAFLQATEQPLGDVFRASKKKDDLADALLHAMAFGAFGKVSAPAQRGQGPKKVVARAPTERQRRTGRLSASNVKYLLRDVPPAEAGDSLRRDPALARALKRHFGSLDDFFSSIKSPKDRARGAGSPAPR